MAKVSGQIMVGREAGGGVWGGMVGGKRERVKQSCGNPHESGLLEKEKLLGDGDGEHGCGIDREEGEEKSEGE